MLDKILFLYHGTQGGQGNIPITGKAVSGGLSGFGQIVIISIVIGLIGWFFWYLKTKS